MQQVTLSIPMPCHENWDNMSPVDKGRFCNACAKEVVDFSAMSDTQVLNYFSNLQNDNVCGRVYPDQLERTITPAKVIKKNLSWYWNYAAMLFLFLGKTNFATAQKDIKPNTAVAPPDKPIDRSVLLVGKMISTVKVITGKVVDEKGGPVPFATIKIKGAKNGIATDAQGAFIIQADVYRDVLQIGAVGYNQTEFILKDRNDYTIVLTKSNLDNVLPITMGIMAIKMPVKNEAVVIAIKDNATMQPIDKATIIVLQKNGGKQDSVFTSGKGLYKLKNLNERQEYTIKIIANGYLEQEANMNANDIYSSDDKTIYLEKAPAVADFKKLTEVVINSSATQRKMVVCRTGGVSVVNKIDRNYIDTIKKITTKINGDLKIFPNPVEKGKAINLVFKLKETGAYHIQIINAGGQMLLLRPIQPSSKNYAELVQTNPGWSAGVYYVRLLNANNKLVSTNSFIIQ